MVHSTNNSSLFELTNLPAAQHYFIAYSGGIDSTVLLYALSLKPELKGLLTAIHVNHNINPAANQWLEHCQVFCGQLNIPLISASVTLKDDSEDSCRQARQNVFKKHLKKGDCLLTGHHQDDQVETVLFRLFRGTGLQGMTGIAQCNEFDHYLIYRPMLSLSQKQIKDYASSYQLRYVEDPSNLLNHYSRNQIRNLIVPELNKYEAQALQNIGSTSRNLKQSLDLLNHLITDKNPFDYQLFLDEDKLATALYHWLHNLNIQAPNRKRLIQFSQDCLTAAADKNPELVLDGCRLLRWQKHIYALHTQLNHFESEILIDLTSNSDSISLPNNGELIFKSTHQVSLPAVVKYQQNHERIKLDINGPHKKLKNLFQQHAIPPWERIRIPYLYIDKQLMAVGSNISSFEFKQLLSEYKAEFRWLSPQFIL